MIDELGLAGAKGVTTPGSRDDVSKAAVENEKQHGEKLNPRETTRFRALCARLNYLALDRVDIQYASKEASRRMSSPQAGDWLLLKRIGRYLLKAPRLVQLFAWQRWTDKVEAFVDSDWAGCATTLRSTSGGVLMLGSHVVKSWSTTQATVALSSGEAELYALVKGASQSLGLLALASDMGHDLQATIHSDSSAAIGITQRKGLGKLRHIRVQMLWVQDGLKRREFSLTKVDGAENVSDVLTKNVDASTLNKHLASMHYMVMAGRAMGAPTLAMMHGIIMQVECELTIDKQDQLGIASLGGWSGGEASCLTDGGLQMELDTANKLEGEIEIEDVDIDFGALDGGSKDEWRVSDDGCAREHRRVRTCLFTPLRVSGAPPAKELCNVRVTVGQFCDSKRVFRICDAWTSRADAHRCLEAPWRGVTYFWRKGSRASV